MLHAKGRKAVAIGNVAYCERPRYPVSVESDAQGIGTGSEIGGGGSYAEIKLQILGKRIVPAFGDTLAKSADSIADRLDEKTVAIEAKLVGTGGEHTGAVRLTRHDRMDHLHLRRGEAARTEHAEQHTLGRHLGKQARYAYRHGSLNRNFSTCSAIQTSCIRYIIYHLSHSPAHGIVVDIDSLAHT